MDRPSTATAGAAPHFYGREDELAWLYGLFNHVAGTGVPRLAVIVAESGIGKTALVQALYRKLTTDPLWDGPSPGGFWPDEFQVSGNKLKANPDFPRDYRPEAPPKFMWLGLAWQDPGNGHPDDRSCPLPEAREVLYRHVKVVQGMPRLWRGFLERLGKKGADLWKGVAEEGFTYALEGVANAAIGSIVPGVKTTVSVAREAYQGKGVRHRDLEEAAKRSAGDELCRELGALMGGRRPLPTIVWLDDAQWIDASSIAFLEKLLRRAKSGTWPLLVIATHWEREWNEYLQHGSEGVPSLTRFADPKLGGNLQTVKRELDKGDRESLRSLLLDRLPGLTLEQQDLMIEKSDGNFLSLEENIGELRGRKLNFENRDEANPLTRAAMKRIEAWESARDRRVEQRFQTLEEEIQNILGWSSRAGARFVRKMIADFAQERMENDSEGRISKCIDPYAILSGSGDRSVVEFRDRAYYRSAMKYFEEYLGTDEDDLREFLVCWFSDWINNCFDDDGDTLRLEDAPDSSLLAAAVEVNRIDLLEMAVRFLPLRDTPDWSEPKPIAAASLRAHCMLVEAYSEEKLWDQCRKVARSLENIDWVIAPMTILCFRLRMNTCSHLVTAGTFEEPNRLAESLLLYCRMRLEETGTPESYHNVFAALIHLGGIEERRGEIDDAYQRFSEALDIGQRLDLELSTPESLGNVSIALRRLGYIEELRGDLDQAHEQYSEALQICQQLAEDLGTPDSRRDVSISLFRLGEIERLRGRLEYAYGCFYEALKLDRQLDDELGTVESQQDVAVSLIRIGDVERLRGNLERAYNLHCGHVFCSFLALVLRDELFRRMDNAGVSAEWSDILRDLNALTETTIAYNGKSFAVRSNAVGVAGKKR